MVTVELDHPKKAGEINLDNKPEMRATPSPKRHLPGHEVAAEPKKPFWAYLVEEEEEDPMLVSIIYLHLKPFFQDLAIGADPDSSWQQELGLPPQEVPNPLWAKRHHLADKMSRQDKADVEGFVLMSPNVSSFKM